jgi:DNA-binding transcriptional LysR family regulator
MHRRYDSENIPIEVLRTFVAVNDAGANFSKAAHTIGLGQPAVSAQIKRLQQIVGKLLFEKHDSGQRLTSDGTVILSYARKIISANDQLLSRTRPESSGERLRIGLPRSIRHSTMMNSITSCTAACEQGTLRFWCEHTENLTHKLASGQLDMALLYEVFTPPGIIFDEWWEQIQWAKSPTLTLKPGESIPLITSDGTRSDRHATSALTDAGLDYHVAFSTRDLATRIAAASTGLGVLVLSASRLTKGLEVMAGPHLPVLPTMRKGIYLRQGSDIAAVKRVAQALAESVKPHVTTNVVSANRSAQRQAQPHRVHATG